jgi:hypothetical protein
LIEESAHNLEKRFLWQAHLQWQLLVREASMLTLENLQAEVLRLPPQDRAHLLDRLIASLDIDTQAEEAWDLLADQREQEMEAGAVQPVPLDVAIARLEARFPG